VTDDCLDERDVSARRLDDSGGGGSETGLLAGFILALGFETCGGTALFFFREDRLRYCGEVEMD
jgi:hypothetical protein